MPHCACGAMLRPRRRHRRVRLDRALALGGALGAAVALPCAASPIPLGTIVITATRAPALGFDLPMSIGAVNRRTIQQAQPLLNLSETINRIPGIDAQNRQDYAQGLRISSRGFGARTPFGVRGVRMLVDGMPATMPDGSGFADVFDLGIARRIEVLRGPFSALYGNASGGVLQVFTEHPPRRPTISPQFWVGSFGSYRAGVSGGARDGRLSGVVDLSRFHTDGFREHSATRQDRLCAKLRWRADPASRWTLLLDALDQPQSLDPGGLTGAEVAADPRQVVPQVLTYDARKTVRHRQAGLIFQHDFASGDAVRLMGYGGTRRVLQFLPFGGSFGLSSGGVVDLHNAFGGFDARWTHHTKVAGMALDWTLGATWNRLDERRKGWVNDFGRIGALRRDENDVVSDFAQYAQASLRPARHWRVDAGVRHGVVRFSSRDHFITSTNPNDSGAVSYAHTSPVLGVLYHYSPRTNLYANFGEGFETPTFAQLAYKPDGSSGLNLALRPATSREVEVGVKSFALPHAETKLALFEIHTSNEIVVASSSNGRTSYTNGGGTLRRGVELSVDAHLPGHFDAYFAFSHLDARFEDGAVAGKRLPGAPASTLYTELGWHEPRSGFFTRLHARAQTRMYVDDANSGAAPGYVTTGWAGGFVQHPGGWRIEEFLRVDNLLDRHYIGAVVVGDRHGRFFEPAPGRNYIVGLKASYRF